MGKYSGPRLVLNKDGDEDSSQGDHSGDLAVAIDKPALKRPSLYNVVLHNDDFTPMEFVVHVLMLFFAMPEARATQVMMMVHTQGRAVCGQYTRDIAETKSAQVNQYAMENDHPLLCEIEKAD